MSLSTAAKSSQGFKVRPTPNFLVPFYLNFTDTYQNPCKGPFFPSTERKKGGVGLNLFYSGVPVFLSGTIGLFKFCQCLSLNHFRFPKIKVRIPNPTPSRLSCLTLTHMLGLIRVMCLDSSALSFFSSSLSFASPTEHYL